MPCDSERNFTRQKETWILSFVIGYSPLHDGEYRSTPNHRADRSGRNDDGCGYFTRWLRAATDDGPHVTARRGCIGR